MSKGGQTINYLWIAPEAYDGLMSHCLAELPREACGLLGGQGRFALTHYPVANVANNPEQEFLMDARGQLEAFNRIEQSGEELIAIYHSHPRTSAFPSQLDIERAYYPHVFYLIVGVAAGQSKGYHGFELKAFVIDHPARKAIGVDWTLLRKGS